MAGSVERNGMVVYGIVMFERETEKATTTTTTKTTAEKRCVCAVKKVERMSTMAE